MSGRLICKSTLAFSRQQHPISQKQQWLTALAITLAVSACIGFSHASSAVPVHFSYDSRTHKLRRSETAASNLRIDSDDQSASLPGSDKIIATDSDHDKWSTARLSVARYGLAATSLPSQGLALFAGGVGAACLLSR
jgi:hypothetical protein